MPATVSIVAPESVEAGDKVRFGSNVDALTDVTFDWAFGDGRRSSEARPMVSFASAGSYTVTLTVRQQARQSRQARVTVPVARPFADVDTPICTGPGRSGWCELNVSPTMIQFVDDQLGWGVNEDIFFKTVDGGQTWEAFTPVRPAVARSTLDPNYRIGFADGRTGWSVHPAGIGRTDWTLLKTVDGGQHWTAQSLVLPGGEFRVGSIVAWSPTRVTISFRSPTVHLTVYDLAGVYEGVLMNSVDGGATWTASSGFYRFETALERALGEPLGRRPPGVTWWAIDMRTGTVVRSRDFGTTFEPVFKPPGTARSVGFSDERRGWVVSSIEADSGLETALWRTDDGGSTWQRASASGLPARVETTAEAALTVSDADVLWLDLSQNEFGRPRNLAHFRSADGGQSWRRLASFDDAIGGRFTVLSSQSAVIDHARFSKESALAGDHFTTDGGLTWGSASLPRRSFVDRLVGNRLWASSAVNRAGRRAWSYSDDAGAHWRSPFLDEASAASDSAGFNFVWGAHARDGRRWEVEEHVNANLDVTLLSTTDGGRSYAVSDVLASVAGSAVHRLAFQPRFQFTSEQAGWRLLSGEVLQRTGDGGRTWSPVNAAKPASTLPGPRVGTGGDFHFIDGQLGWLAWASYSGAAAEFVFAPEGRVFATTDGGQTWTSRPVPIAPFGIRFADAMRGVVVGHAGGIALTTDGGASWSVRPSGTDQALRRVAWVDPMTAMAIGDGGTLLRSVDGGVTWSSMASGSTGHWRDVAFADAQRGWVVGNVVLGTHDGGASWAVEVPTPVRSRGGAFAAVQALATGGAMAFHSDGGVWATK